MSSKRNHADSLERFAIRVEDRIRAGGSSITIENLVARAITQKKNPVLAFKAAEAWITWRFGKPKERHEHTGEDGGAIVHTIRFGDGNSDKDE